MDKANSIVEQVIETNKGDLDLLHSVCELLASRLRRLSILKQLEGK